MAAQGTRPREHRKHRAVSDGVAGFEAGAGARSLGERGGGLHALALVASARHNRRQVVLAPLQAPRRYPAAASAPRLPRGCERPAFRRPRATSPQPQPTRVQVPGRPVHATFSQTQGPKCCRRASAPIRGYNVRPQRRKTTEIHMFPTRSAVAGRLGRHASCSTICLPSCSGPDAAAFTAFRRRPGCSQRTR